MNRIGIFGGSFDPVHCAHVALARVALDELALDELCWVPAGEPWQKLRTLAPAADRLAMLRLAIADEPRFTVSRCEIERAGPSYTLDTVREMQAARPGRHWFLVIGQDQYTSLHTWHEWRSLLGLVTLAVASRPGAPLLPDAQLRQFEPAVVALPMMEVSSTDIRARIAQAQGIDDLVPPEVARYIDQHRLYQGNHPTRS